MCRLSAEIGRPVTFALTQNDAAPDQWRELADLSYEAVEQGASVHPQVAGRPFGLLLGHATTNAFIDRPSYAALAELPYEEKVERLREPKLRRRSSPRRSPGGIPSPSSSGTATTRCTCSGIRPTTSPGPS